MTCQGMEFPSIPPCVSYSMRKSRIAWRRRPTETRAPCLPPEIVLGLGKLDNKDLQFSSSSSTFCTIKASHRHKVALFCKSQFQYIFLFFSLLSLHCFDPCFACLNCNIKTPPPRRGPIVLETPPPYNNTKNTRNPVSTATPPIFPRTHHRHAEGEPGADRGRLRPHRLLRPHRQGAARVQPQGAGAQALEGDD